MEQLNHPNLIRLLETIDSPKRIHIVMEFAGGCVPLLRAPLVYVFVVPHDVTLCIRSPVLGAAVATCAHT